MLRKLLIPLFFGLAGCTSTTVPFEAPTRGFAATSPTQIPTIVPVTTRSVKSAQRSNASIAQDFMQLSFAFESGTQLNYLTRFEGPISVRIEGNAPNTMYTDLENVLSRFRNEAGISIHATSVNPANITIEMVPRAQIQRLVPNAACFVAPNVRGLKEYINQRRSDATSWSNLRERNVMSIFVPSDTSPQEIRDCLHEELAQALGPVNDLYSLTDSVFNDDNVHSALTSFDMLVLRIYYDSELKNGMSRAEVANRIPQIIARLNPAGAHIYSEQSSGISPRWNSAIQTALGAGTSSNDRIRAAENAIALAKNLNFEDVRVGFSYFVLGRVSMSSSASVSKNAFMAADRAYASLPNTDLHRALVASQLAAFTLADGDATGTLRLVRPFMNTAKRHENAALLSTLMLLEAEALEQAGNATDARSVRLDSLDLARYGFGSEKAVQARLREIASLSRS